MESAASGLMAGISVVRAFKGEKEFFLPEFTMIGALLKYICTVPSGRFQPMGANFGIMPPLERVCRDKNEKYAAYSQRSLQYFDHIKQYDNSIITG